MKHTLTRAGWYAAAASIPATALLLAFGGGHLNTFMFWFLLLGFTATSTARIRAWWLTRKTVTTVHEVPIDYGVGMQPAPFRLEPDFGSHADSCDICKRQAPSIPAA